MPDNVTATRSTTESMVIDDNTTFALEEVSTLNGQAVPPQLVQRVAVTNISADGVAEDVSPATSGKQDTGNTSLASILAKLSSDPATQTTLAAILTKLTSDPSTATKQDTGNTSLAAILAKISSDPATQTTLAAILAKLTSDPATNTTLTAGFNALLAALASVPVTGAFYPATQPVSGSVTANAGTNLNTSSLALEAGGNLAAILAKMSSDPATQTTLAAVLAKLSSDPATQTTLAAILTKLNASLAVTGTFWQATQPVSGPLTDTQLRATAVPVSLAALPALVASAAKIGVVTTDQTTHGTTDLVAADNTKIGGTAIDTNSGNKSAGTQRVVLATDQPELGHIGEVGGRTVTVGVERTRPADTTAYAANDAVADSTSAPTAITFAGMSRVASGSGYITRARLVTDQSANVAQFRLWLFNAQPNTIQNDNAAYLIKYADKLTCIGYIDFPPFTTETGSDCAQALVPDVRLAFTADASSQLYGVLQTRTAFTPANAQKIYIVLSAEQN